MIIAYLDKNPKNIGINEQRAKIEVYAKKKRFTEIMYVENSDILSVRNTGKRGQTILVANMVCLGANLEQIKDSLLVLNGQKLNLISVDEGYEFSGKKSEQLLRGFQMAVDIRSRCNSLFMKKALAEKKNKGGRLGRLCGAKNKRKSLCELNKDFIIQALKSGMKKSDIAQTVGVSTRTLFNFEKTLAK